MDTRRNVMAETPDEIKKREQAEADAQYAHDLIQARNKLAPIVNEPIDLDDLT